MANILVIDDEKGIVSILKDMFEMNGHAVLTANDGKEGLALGQSRKIDLVITDIFMPEQDGFETILTFKNMFPDLKIIAISGGGYFDQENALRMAGLFGAHYAFNKPFDILEVLAKVNELLA